MINASGIDFFSPSTPEERDSRVVHVKFTQFLESRQMFQARVKATKVTKWD
jgi:hypothetical protein